MGEVIYLERHRSEHAHGPVQAAAPIFLFDLASPESYLVAERIERTLGDVEWIPVDGSCLVGEPDRGGVHEWRMRAESAAREQRLPLVWPERFPARVPCALRAAAYACELGAGASFALAAFRLAFCGGFALDDPEVLAEAAAAAGVPLDECLAAAGESSRDEDLRAASDHLCSRGVLELPAIRAEGRWFGGESGMLAASALVSLESLGRSLAPAG
jgi:2-hydroxychromene-2-carboxylate isomerase